MHHGSTPAAWTAVILALVGMTVGGIALIPHPNWVIFWIGVAIVAVGGLAGLIMPRLGFGAKRAEAH